jgi:hypothetical protein
MARNNDGIFDEVWADNGDKAQPIFPITTGWDSQYSTPISSGGLAPARTTFNYTLNQLYALGVDVNRMGGALVWNSLITYQRGATVIGGSDGLLYTSRVNGNINFDPNNNSSPTQWTKVARYLELEDQTAGLEGSKLIGHTSKDVFTAINDRPTSTTLATNGGAALIGTTLGGTAQDVMGRVRAFGRCENFGLLSGSYNVASVTDEGNNTTRFTFTNQMPNTTYAVSSSIIGTNPLGVTPVSIRVAYTGDLNFIEFVGVGSTGSTEPAPSISFVIFSV